MSSPLLALSKVKGFPQDFHETGKILTIEFFEACNEVITELDKAGVLFKPLVADMRGNVNQLLEHYRKDESSRMFIEDMILRDEHRKTHTWLLWLKRALELLERFFWHVLNDTDVMTEITDDLRSHIGKAYDEVLRPFHGFLSRRSFEVVHQFMPSRSRIFGTGNQFRENMELLKIHLPRAKCHIDKINRLYIDNNLNYEEKTGKLSSWYEGND